MVKKTVAASVLLILFAGAALCTLNTNAASTIETAIQVNPVNVVMTTGKECVVFIEVSNVECLYGWEFNVTYDASILDFVGYSLISGGLNEPLVVWNVAVDETAGELRFAVSSCYPASGISYENHAVVSLAFTSVGVGASQLHLHDTLLATDTAEPIVHTSNDGSITVTANEGDLNGDGRVNILDAVIVSMAWGMDSSSPNWNPIADLNDDNVINICDAARMSSNWSV